MKWDSRGGNTKKIGRFSQHYTMGGVATKEGAGLMWERCRKGKITRPLIPPPPWKVSFY